MDIKLTGKTIDGSYTSELYRGAVFNYTLYLPNAPEGTEDYALIVHHDGLNLQEAYASQTLAEEGACPYCICIGIHPAFLSATVGEGRRGLRMNTYDVYSEKYPNFVIDEFIPYLSAKYGLRISPSPDMHMVSGGSSGGVSAWNMAWHRPDYFKRVYMSSPSFLSMARGDELVSLIRKCETKPIRVYVDYSENEPDDYFGSSFCAAEASVRALRFARYDLTSKYYAGEGHCSRWRHAESALERMRVLWSGWKEQKITACGYSPRVENVVGTDSAWESSPIPFPRAPHSPYEAVGGEIFYLSENGKKIRVADGFGNITGMAVSADKWRLYIADGTRGCIYAASILRDGTLDGVYTHGILHHKTDFRTSGAVSICIDSEDRLYVSTEVGIQTVRACSLIDAILDNPAGTPAQRLSIGEDGYLYAECEDRIYRRKLNQKKPPQITPTEAKHISYYD